MKIAILTHAGMPFGFDYAEHFARRGHAATVLSLTPNPPGRPGVTVETLDTRGFDSDSGSRLQYLRAIGPVRRAVRRLEPDVLFAVYLTSAGTLACLSGHPRVALSAHGSDVNDQIGSRVWRAVFRWQFRRARLVHVVSDLMARALQERAGLDARKTVVAAVGTDPRLFAFVAPAARPKGRIVCTRAHDPLYRQDTVVRALRRLRDRDVPCHLTFGHAKGAEHTRALVEELGVADCVTFLPGYRRAELPALLAGATVYVSASRSDGTSVSLLEALSTGLFPVVSDIPANRPWVEHGRNGFLFPVGDEAALADRLAEALARPDLRAAAAPISRELVVRNGDAEPLADRVLAAVRAVVP